MGSTLRHIGEPLTRGQVAELPDGAEVIITWDGGNGPWPYRVLVDSYGARRTETIQCDRILGIFEPHDEPDQLPRNRVTLGWDDEARSFWSSTPRPLRHIVDKWAQLRAEVVELGGDDSHADL